MEGLTTRHLCLHVVPPLRLTTVSRHLPANTGLFSSPMTCRSSSARGVFGRRFLAKPFLRPTARSARCAIPSRRHGAFALLAIPLFARTASSATPKVVAGPRTPSSRSLNLMCTVGDDGLQRPPSKHLPARAALRHFCVLAARASLVQSS